MGRSLRLDQGRSGAPRRNKETGPLLQPARQAAETAPLLAGDHNRPKDEVSADRQGLWSIPAIRQAGARSRAMRCAPAAPARSSSIVTERSLRRLPNNTVRGFRLLSSVGIPEPGRHPVRVHNRIKLGSFCKNDISNHISSYFIPRTALGKGARDLWPFV